MFGRIACAIALLVATAGLSAGNAAAAGGNYVFVGGTAAEQGQVVSALNASSFDWSLVPAQITIRIVRGVSTSEASPGQIWLDADLLDAGRFSWGVVQHGYAHEVDFYLLDAAKRAQLGQQLKSQDWCYGVPGLPHAAYGCERFASTLAWSYWMSPDNSMRPQSSDDESAALPPAQFRALLAQLLANPSVNVAPPAQLAHAPALKHKTPCR
jgi:hypothetical protein